MVTVIKKGTPIAEIVKILNRITTPSNRGIDSTKYAGKLKLGIDPVKYQKSLRDEWQ